MSLRQSVYVDLDKCTGCGICELVCSEFHEKKYGLKTSRIRTVSIGHTVRMPLTCRLCERPPCVESCPRDAFRSTSKTGVLILDEDKCSGCGWCVRACDLGLMLFHPTQRIPIACDLCEEDPQCIPQCPFEALSLRTNDAYASGVRKLLVQETIKSMEEAK